MEDENRFVIEKILDQHLLYEQKSSDTLGAFTRVVFAMNAGVVVMILLFLAFSAQEGLAIAAYRPLAGDIIDFFFAGATFAVLSGLFSWWSYGTIAQRKRMMLAEVFGGDEVAGANRSRSERLIDAIVEEGRHATPGAAYLSLAAAVLAMAAFILGCQQLAVGFAG